MGRGTRRMIERLEPFAELRKKGPSEPLVKADDDGKDGERKEWSARPRPPAAKRRAK
jgi:hypothetical protein